MSQPPKYPINLVERLIWLQNPINFLSTCVFTMDEVDKNAPVKAAPMHLPYVETIATVWADQNNSKLVIDKSRRMWISWLMLALHLHATFTATNRRTGIVSKKFEDACAHLKNMEFIYKNIPEDIYPVDCRPKMRIKEGFIHFDELDSVIHALASGPDQARQYGFSFLFFDELDFWQEQESTYSAAKPTLQGGGKITIVSTHALVDSGVTSFYRKLVEDRL